MRPVSSSSAQKRIEAGTDQRPSHGWRRTRLGDVLALRKDVIHPRDNPSGPAVFVGLEHIESHTGRRTGSIELDMARLTGRKPQFRKGDIVYGYLRPYLNKVWVAEFDGLCSVDQYVFEVDGAAADVEFIAWFMRSPTYLRRAPIGTTPGQLPRIRTDEVASVELDLPPLAEQRRIAARLREQLAEVVCARAAVQAQFDAAQALLSALLRAAFQIDETTKWPTNALGEVADITSGITLGRPLRGQATRRVPYLRVANVKDGFLDLSDVFEIDATEAEIEKCLLKRGDILLTEGRDADKLGRGTFWEEQITECVHQNHIFRVRLDPARFCHEYIAFQISSPYGKAYFAAHAKQTTGIATINRRVLDRFPLIIPPPSRQRQIAASLREQLVQGGHALAAAKSQLDAIARLPAALLSDTFQDSYS